MRRTTAVLTGGLAIVVALAVVGVLLLRVADRQHHRAPPGSIRATWASVAVEGRSVHVSYEDSPCSGPSSLDIEERSDRVVLTLSVKHPPRPCVALATRHEVEGRLHSPLAGRPVYDGACLAASDGPGDESCQRWPR